MEFTVQSMSVADTYHHQHLFDENMVQIEMPLIAPVSMHYPHHRHNVYYPYNLTGFQSGPSVDNIISEPGGNMEKHQSRFQTKKKTNKKYSMCLNTKCILV